MVMLSLLCRPQLSEETTVDSCFIIEKVHQLVEEVSASLSFCKDNSISAPPELNLSEPGALNVTRQLPVIVCFILRCSY